MFNAETRPACSFWFRKSTIMGEISGGRHYGDENVNMDDPNYA